LGPLSRPPSARWDPALYPISIKEFSLRRAMEQHCMGSHASPISSLRQTTFNSDIEGLGSQAALTSSAIQLLLLAFATLLQEFTVIHGRIAPKLTVTPSAAPALITSGRGRAPSRS
jgi:hypothetical protein